MIKIDLITGFLGSGKTTFIRYYARYLLDQGYRLCILENDFGAINIDRTLLQDLLGENCGMEMIVGGDGFEAHQRRMKTKLIAMAMNGYDRVLVEPSGIFDVDELFDLLYEEPLDRWYERGNVLTIVDARLPENMSKEADYLLASQCACAGRLILSKTQLSSDKEIDGTILHINQSLEMIGAGRRFERNADVECRDWRDLTSRDMEDLANAGYCQATYVKQHVVQDGHFQSLFCFGLELSGEELVRRIEGVFDDPSCKGVFRIKGYMHTSENRWIQINATREKVEITPCVEAQDVIIVIGEQLDKEVLNHYFPLR